MVTAGEDRYRAAAAKAAAARPAVQMMGGPDAPARAAALMQPCVTPVPGGTCGHQEIIHMLGTRKGRPVRTWCSCATAAGQCPCTRYTTPPPPEDP